MVSGGEWGGGGGKARPICTQAGCPKTKEQRTDAILYSLKSAIFFPIPILGK